MPVPIPADHVLVIPLDSINDFLHKSSLPVLDTLPPCYRFTDNKDTLNFLMRMRGDIVSVYTRIGPGQVAHGQGYGVGSTSISPNSYLYYLQQRFVYEEHVAEGIILGVGSPQFLLLVRDLVRSVKPDADTYSDYPELETTSIPEGIVEFTTLGGDIPYAYIATESTLFRILEDYTLPQDTRIITALISTFPYAKEFLIDRVKFIGGYEGETQIDHQGLFAEAQQEGEDSARRLTLLAIYILGPAYSRRDKLHEQIGKRAKAAGIQGGLTPLDPAKTNDLLQNIQWKVDNTGPIVDDVLGAVICYTKQKDINPDASLDQFESHSNLVNQRVIGTVAGALLEQARLVYRNYHSTSLHFILPVIDIFERSIGPNHATFASDFTHFKTIEAIVRTAPYMGLRSRLPDQYHIKNCARLAYLGILYHQKSLTSQAEIDSFKEYKVQGIKDHIQSAVDHPVVENVAEILPPPSTAAIASLVQHIPLEKATTLMAARTEQQKREVLEVLRAQDNKGAWAEDYIQQENAAYTKEIINKGIDIVKAMLNETYESKLAEAENAPTIEEIRQQRANVITWKSQVMREISAISPWTDALPAATKEGQATIRNALIERFQAISNIITGAERMEH